MWLKYLKQKINPYSDARIALTLELLANLIIEGIPRQVNFEINKPCMPKDMSFVMMYSRLIVLIDFSLK